MGKIGETTLEINLAALEHNFKYLKSRIDPETKFLAVVKAFAYGSDMLTVAKKMENLGVDYLGVAYTKEGVLLREGGIKCPILVLHPQPANFAELIQHHLEPSIYSPNLLRSFLQFIEGKQSAYSVHLKFNTGLNRLGFWENDVDFIVEQLEGRNEIKVVSVFSHLAASEDPKEKEFSQRQIQSFQKICEHLNGKLGYTPFRHMLNTSGIINYPEAQFEMVRSGIGLYGYGNEEKWIKT